MLYARLTTPSKAISTDPLEVIGNVIHFLFFEVRDDDIYFIASGIMHAAQEHKFWKLGYDGLRFFLKKKGDWEQERWHTIVKTTGIMDSFLSCIE